MRKELVAIYRRRSGTLCAYRFKAYLWDLESKVGDGQVESWNSGGARLIGHFLTFPYCLRIS
jgi:hypothetical protein